MTTNQTIDGVLVSRELAQALANLQPRGYFPNGNPVDELRALLDAPVHPCSVQLDGCDGPCTPAAQPPGEPVAVMCDGREGGPCMWFSRPPSGTKLYAEQPAPVAVVRMCDCNQGRLPCNGECKLCPVNAK